MTQIKCVLKHNSAGTSIQSVAVLCIDVRARARGAQRCGETCALCAEACAISSAQEAQRPSRRHGKGAAAGWRWERWCRRWCGGGGGRTRRSSSPGSRSPGPTEVRRGDPKVPHEGAASRSVHPAESARLAPTPLRFDSVDLWLSGARSAEMRGLDVRYRGRGLQIHCICFVSSSVPDTIDTEQAVSGASGSRYSGYRLYLAQFQIQWIRI